MRPSLNNDIEELCQELKKSPTEYFLEKLETARSALDECLFFTDNEDLKREISQLADHVSKIIGKLTPKPPPRLPPSTDEEVYKRWLRTQQ